jgi:hypothetical protein
VIGSESGDDSCGNGDLIEWVTVGNSVSDGLIPSELYLGPHDPFDMNRGLHVYLLCTKSRLIIRRIKRREGGRLLRVTIAASDGRSSRGHLRNLDLDLQSTPLLNRRLDPEGYLEATLHGRQMRFSATQLVAFQVRVLRSGLGPSYERAADTLVQQFMTMDVQYVGQSIGSDGARSAFDRLTRGHPKFERLMSEVHDFQRHLEVYVVVIDCNIRFHDLAGTVTADNAREFAMRSLRIRSGAIHDLLDLRRLVSLSEASLIRLFRPRLNVRMKDFPHAEAPTIRQALTNEGLTCVGIQINVRDAAVKLRTPDGRARELLEVYFDLSTGVTIRPDVLLINKDVYFDHGPEGRSQTPTLDHRGRTASSPGW